MLEGKEVLVTGGAGFIGSEVVRTLFKQYKNVTVRVLDDFSFGGLFNLCGLSNFRKRLYVFRADLREKDSVKKAVKGTDIIFHLAARPFIPECYSHPEEIFRANVIGTLNLLNNFSQKIERFVHISSSEVYGTSRYIPMDEGHVTRPHSTYATSKLAAENLVFTLSKEKGIPAVILRPFNTYGPRDSHPRIIPEIISQLYRGKTLRLGNTSTMRDFSYVSDIASGITKAATMDEAVGEIINLGSGVGTSIKELIGLISGIMKVDCHEVLLDERKLRRYDVKSLCADISKAERLLKWKPSTSLRKGLKETIEWYTKNGAKWRWEMKDYANPYVDQKSNH